MSKLNFSKSFVLTVIRLVLKYVVPVVLGYIEGDSHVIEDTLFSVL